jgi:hypothetical protein
MAWTGIIVIKMVSNTLALYYAGICTVPLYFCIFAFRRVYIHRLDGPQVDSLPISGIYTSKRLLTSSLVMCSVAASVLELIKSCEIKISHATQLSRCFTCWLLRSLLGVLLVPQCAYQCC